MINEKLNHIQVKVHNEVWVLNRITNLLRRRKYNIEQLDLVFDNNNFTYITFALCWIDQYIEHVIKQIFNLYEVIDVKIIDNSSIYYSFYVHFELDETIYIDWHDSLKTINTPNKIIKYYHVRWDEIHEFINILNVNNLYYLSNIENSLIY